MLQDGMTGSRTWAARQRIAVGGARTVRGATGGVRHAEVGY
ncbi:hypothetical protein ACIBEK_00710 [Nocardia fusca]|uniref:Uncharacterized protein n=1 Tax=Nocardia fusca TaxID=941183 RepID=A0ABV3F036_9NOCA